MLSIFIATLAAIFIAEMGDKTQLLLVAMASKYKVRDILIGTWAATIVLNLLAVAVGAALSKYLDMRIIKGIATLAFFYFSWSTLKDINDDEEEEMKESKSRLAIFAIFGAFFIGELGDKTQLSGITMAAAYTEGSIVNAIAVFAGCTLGLILADLIGLLAGLFLKSKMPTTALNIVSVLIFGVFGILNCFQASSQIFPMAGEEIKNGVLNVSRNAFILGSAVTAAFCLLMGITTALVIKARKVSPDKHNS